MRTRRDSKTLTTRWDKHEGEIRWTRIQMGRTQTRLFSPEATHSASRVIDSLA